MATFSWQVLLAGKLSIDSFLHLKPNSLFCFVKPVQDGPKEKENKSILYNTSTIQAQVAIQQYPAAANLSLPKFRAALHWLLSRASAVELFKTS